MSQQTTVRCDACGADLTYTGNSVDYRIVLASQAKAHYPESPAVTDMHVADPLPETKHFCDLGCLAAWAASRSATRGRLKT